MATTRQDIIDGTIRCAYKLGLPAITINTIGKEVGILGQGLYNHFDSKDDILSACFDYCKKQIGALYQGYVLDPRDDLSASVKKLWMIYFNYFVNHPEECAFYRNYRELMSSAPPPEEEEDAYLKDLWRLSDELDKKYHIFQRIPRRTMLYYVRNLTPYLARAISDNIMEDTPEVREQLWMLAANGLSLLEQS